MNSRVNDRLDDFIRSLFYEKYNDQWVCVNSLKVLYDNSAFSQQTNIVKYRLNINSDKVTRVYFTADKMNAVYNLEVVFACEDNQVYELPVDDKTYQSRLAKLNDAILSQQAAKLNDRIIHDLIL